MKSRYRPVCRRWFEETLASWSTMFNTRSRNYKSASIEVKWHTYDAKPPSREARMQICAGLFDLMDAFDGRPAKKGKRTAKKEGGK